MAQNLNETHVNTQICWLAVGFIRAASLDAGDVLITVSVHLYWNFGKVKVFHPSDQLPFLPPSPSLPPPQSEESSLLQKQMNQSGICIHNGIVYQDKNEWTVDSCTECTCQVSVIARPGIEPEEEGNRHALPAIPIEW